MSSPSNRTQFYKPLDGRECFTFYLYVQVWLYSSRHLKMFMELNCTLYWNGFETVLLPNWNMATQSLLSSPLTSSPHPTSQMKKVSLVSKYDLVVADISVSSVLGFAVCWVIITDR